MFLRPDPRLVTPTRRASPAKAAAVAIALAAAAPLSRAAGTFTVTNADNAGSGSLRQAMLDANSAGGGTINITQPTPITLFGPLPIVSTPMTINGNNTPVGFGPFLNFYRVFFVDAPNGGAVAFSNLTVRNGNAFGGAGGFGGGGGGLGAGGGLFVSRGNVTLSNVTFTDNTATGGTGGAPGGVPGALNGPLGGGGGLGGPGGAGGTFTNGSSAFAGGGGYLGAGGGAGNSGAGGVGGGGGLDTNGESGADAGAGGGEGGVGPASGGGNPGGVITDAGGGGGSLASPGTDGASHGGDGGGNGGNGGRFGGGGASGAKAYAGGYGGDFGGGGAGGRGGAGGFGGGGGAGYFAGGGGGFGAGGGGGDVMGTFGAGGAFGGKGGSPFSVSVPDKRDNSQNAGGGGAALGAQIFVSAGATLIVSDTIVTQGTLAPGLGGTSDGFFHAQPGLAAGDGLFLAGPTTFSVSAGQTRTIAGSIADVGDFINHPTARGFALARLTKTGPGTLVLSRPNSYGGGTVISQGTLSTVTPTGGALGSGPITFNDANTGAADATLLLSFPDLPHAVTVADAGSGGAATLASVGGSAQPAVFSGPFVLKKGLTILARNTTAQDPQHSTGQTRLDGPVSGPGGLTISGGNMAQFRAAPKTYAGVTRVAANSTLSLFDPASTPLNSTVQIDAGSTVVLEGLPSATLGGLAGAGTLANNPAYVQSFVAVGNDNADTAFTGQITGRVRLSKVGTGTLALGPHDNATLGLTVSAGRVRLAGDHRVESLFIDTAAPGPQALDLAGHAVRIFTGGMQGIALESHLNRRIGTAADGIYDSTARAGTRVGIRFDGDGQPLLMKLTLAGDATLDGLVDFNDLVKLAQNYNGGEFSAFWDDGDFTYDQKVDFNDLVLLAQNYNSAFTPASPLPGAPADFADDLAAAFASVPEPSTPLALLAACGFARATRRRRTRRAPAPHLTAAASPACRPSSPGTGRTAAAAGPPRC